MSEKKLETMVDKPELLFNENGENFIMLDNDVEVDLDSGIKNVLNYMNDNKGLGKDDIEKDALYASAQSLYVEYKNKLRESKFNFFLNRPQYNLLSDILLKKLEYDVNTLFIAMELTDMLKSLHDKNTFKDDVELFEIKLTATELTYMYHLIQNHKVKGLTKESYTFASLLTRIGNVSKIINYYDARAKSLVEDIQNWAVLLDGSEPLIGEVLPNESSAVSLITE